MSGDNWVQGEDTGKSVSEAVLGCRSVLVDLHGPGLKLRPGAVGCVNQALLGHGSLKESRRKKRSEKKA